MRNFKPFFAFIFIILLGSCDKNELSILSSENQMVVPRTSSVATLPIQWLESFRLNLLNKQAIYSYNVTDAEYGVESIYNLLAAKGVSQISNQRIHKSEIILSTNNGMLSQNEISALSNLVYQSVKQYAYKSSPGLMLVDLASTIDGNSVKYTVSTYTGNLSNPIYNYGAGFGCTEDAFDALDCFRSAYGDADAGNGPYYGGPCGDVNDLTSAQEEVQNAILNDIPKYVYGWKNQIVGKYVYTNSSCQTVTLWNGSMNESLEKFSNCTSLNLDYNDNQSVISEIEYNSDELNCTVCMLKEHFKSICPPGKAVCNVNIWGDQLGGGYWKWVGEVCFCDVKVVSTQIEMIPDTLNNFPPPIDSLLNGSILNF